MSEDRKLDRKEELLTRLVDNRLAPDEQAEAKALLAAEPEMRQALAAFQKIGQAARQARGLEKPSLSVEQFLKERIRPELERRQALQNTKWTCIFGRPRVRLAAMALPVLLVVAAVIFTWNIGKGPENQTLVSTPGPEGKSCYVESLETEIPEATLLAYHSEQENLTVLWLFDENSDSSPFSGPS
jgi:hypothetical protein